MRVVVAMDSRFDRTPDGAIWNPFISGSFCRAHLEVFDEVCVLARVRDVPERPAGACRADGGRIRFSAVPHYVGPWAYLKKAVQVDRAVRRAVQDADAILLHGGSQVAARVDALLLKGGRRPYGICVLGDPYEVFSKGVSRHPLRPLLQTWLTRQLQRQCAAASAASYVTQQSLQQRYPAGRSARTEAFSNIRFAPDWFLAAPRSPSNNGRPLRLLFVGSLEQLYKGPDVLLKAVARCRQQGLRLEVRMAGEGKFFPLVERLVQQLGLAGQVQLLGAVPAGEPIRNLLDWCDLFVLPSLTEGLPRALLEAMARGLPCIASSVGGIPELLAAEDLVPPGDVEALAGKLLATAADPQRRAAMAARNLIRARDYSVEKLHGRELAFLRSLREQTEQWLREGSP